MKRLLIGLLAVLSLTACGTQEDAAAQQKREQNEPATFAAVPTDTQARSGLKSTRSALSTTLASDAIVWDDECFALSLPANDDGSTNSIGLPFALNFFGNTHTRFYINNNGNVTFSAPMGTYTPFVLGANTPPIIAPFFADVDTRYAGSGPVSGLTTFSQGTFTFEGHRAFCVSWVDVGYWSRHSDKRNTFQLLLVDRSDTGSGNFDIVMNYSRVLWETGDASGGRNGFGGTSAGAGFSAGTGDAANFFQFPGSLVNGALLDSNTSTGLIHGSRGSNIPGRYVFNVRNGRPDIAPPVSTLTVAPGPDANGENHGPVNGVITSTDSESGVASITYVLSGATTGGETVAGSAAILPTISNLGVTTLTYFATDVAGNREAPRTYTINITQEAPPAPECISVHLNDYNLFLLENYEGGHDVVGKVAARGNISMHGFGVGSGLPASDTTNVLVAGGLLDITNGAVFGDAFYGGSTTADGTVTFVRGALAQGEPIDFVAREAYLQQLSERLGQVAANGTTRREVWGGLYLQGTDPELNVFEVDGSAFTGAVLFNIDAPAGSLAVVNVRGNTANFQGFGISFSGGINQHGVLYNFVTTTSINLQGFGMFGTVLAPYAHITFYNGSWDGGIYAQSLTGDAEGHINALDEFEICLDNSDPTGPGTPSDPTGPGNPSDPTGPGNPSDPTGPGNPSDPTGPTDPTDPGAPGEDPGAPGDDTGGHSDYPSYP